MPTAQSSLGEELSLLVDQGMRVTDPGNIPKPGFVIKSWDGDQRKVFINVCSSARLRVPRGWDVDGDFMASVLREEGWEKTICLEFLISQPKMDVDKRGNACTVIHCAAHPRVLEAAHMHRDFKMHLIAMVLSRVSTCTGMYLDPDIKLPKMKCKGDVESILSWGVDENALMEILSDSRLPLQNNVVEVEVEECMHRFSKDEWRMSFIGNPVHRVRIVVTLPQQSCRALSHHPDAGHVCVAGSEVCIDLPKSYASKL